MTVATIQKLETSMVGSPAPPQGRGATTKLGQRNRAGRSTLVIGSAHTTWKRETIVNNRKVMHRKQTSFHAFYQ